jgi:L-threonylcarbamoyladenylate synthase
MRVERVGIGAPRRAAIRRGAELLRAGRLVAFPTETVYGLGAHALDEAAVQRVYEAKGRPSLNPLIVHVASVDAARALARDWNDSAEKLAAAFWPGPLTLVVRKAPKVPDLVTAKQDTVGLRVPRHAIALELLVEANIPVAAPSANLSTQVSPTTAQHVVRGLGARVDLVLDGGATSVGIESTVADVTGSIPRILRPGMISRDDIAAVVGDAEAASTAEGNPDGVARSPGVSGRHYAPQAILRLFPSTGLQVAAAEARSALQQRCRVGAMTLSEFPVELSESRRMPGDPAAYARALYATLHSLDDAACDVVYVEQPPPEPAWAGVRDRLERAAR